MNICRYILHIILVSLLSASTLRAQEAEAKMRIDTNVILIGDPVKLTIEALMPRNMDIVWIAFADSISKIVEVLEEFPTDTVHIGADNIKYTQELLITSYDSGYYAIPPFYFGITEPESGETQIIFSEPLLLTVNTLEVDTTLAFRDIKGPMSAPWTLREALPYILYTLGGILLIILLWIAWRTFVKKKPVLQFANKPVIPPHIKALKALDELSAKKLWHNNRVKEYYVELSEIIRVYLEERHGIIAMEMTSDEILTQLIELKSEEDLINKLSFVLRTADLVKFAKAIPLPNEHESCMISCRDYVKQTIPSEETNGQSKTEKENGTV